MIFRAQSLKSLGATQKIAAFPSSNSRQAGTASQRHAKGALLKSASLVDLQNPHKSEPYAEKSRNAIKTSREHPDVKGSQVLASDSHTEWTAPLLGLSLLVLGGPAYAAYDRTAGDQLFKNLAGGAYILLVCFFFYRLFRRRAESGTSQSLRGQFQESIQDEMKAKEKETEDKPVTPAGALWGAVQAGAICFALFQVCGLIDGYFGNQEMPDQYTARNVTVTLRTIVRGLAYLITFLFGVNCVGLSGLAIQLLFFPDKTDDTKQEDKAQS